MNSVIDSMFSIDVNLLYAILLSVALGFIIGFEREMTNKWAGLRTHILVCVGSCTFTLLSIHVFPTIAADGNFQAFGDPARISAQILTGIGFIGGGTVLRHRASIYGLTTASTLWITASIGMACGCSRFDIATYTTILAIGVLVLVRIVEKQFIHQPSKMYRKLKVLASIPKEVFPTFINQVKETFKVIELSSVKAERTNPNSDVSFVVLTNDKKSMVNLYEKLNSIQEVNSINIQEVYD